MAMNKKEQVEFEQARSHRSLRFSDYPTSKDVSANMSAKELVVGFDANVHRVVTISSINGAVYPAWSSHDQHGAGDSPAPRGHSSQGGISLYSTRKRALGALRRELEDKFARLLLEIDDAIAQEDNRVKGQL